MDLNDIKLSSMSKLFEYEKQVRIIDECNSVEDLREMLKCSIKLYLQQQEVISELGLLWI